MKSPHINPYPSHAEMSCRILIMGSSDWYTWVIDSRDLISRDIGHVTFRHVFGSFLYLLCSSFLDYLGDYLRLV